jgi:hypothetical protein
LPAAASLNESGGNAKIPDAGSIDYKFNKINWKILHYGNKI